MNESEIKSCLAAKGSADNETLIKYLNERREQFIQYRKILEGYGILPIRQTLVVGKTQKDSIFGGTDAQLMAPNVIDDENKIHRAIPTFEIINGMESVLNVVSHNPYDFYELHLMRELANNSKKNISLGMFGTKYDKDIEEKKQTFQSFLDSIAGNYEGEEITIGDNIFYTVRHSENPKIMMK